VLEKYGIPATIFLATGFVGTDRLFWPEQFMFYLSRLGPLSDAALPEGLRGRLPSGGNRDNEVYDSLVAELKNWDEADRQKLLLQLGKRVAQPLSERQLMNWQEAAKMYKSGLVSFGAHTSGHVILDRVPPEQAEREIVQSRDEMGQNLGLRPTLFAYPNGNFTPELKDMLLRHGFEAAMTTHKAWIGRDCDLFAMPRIGIHEDISRSLPLFEARLFLKRF
jgi:peptidoglycan/xylan/chitin deacetylase (PgdA/CDA1 family)